MKLIAQLTLNFLEDGLFLNERVLGFFQIACQVIDRHLPLLAVTRNLIIVPVTHLDDLCLKFQILRAELLERFYVVLSLLR